MTHLTACGFSDVRHSSFTWNWLTGALNFVLALASLDFSCGSQTEMCCHPWSNLLTWILHEKGPTTCLHLKCTDQLTVILLFNFKSHAGYTTAMREQSLVVRLYIFTDMSLTPMLILWCCSTVYKNRMYHNTKIPYCTRVIPRCKLL